MVRAQREDELLAAAGDLFAAQGYSATRLEDVAQRAGVAKGLVTFYFKSKEGLFRAVVRRLIPPLLAELEGVVAEAEGTSAADLLRAAMAMVFQRMPGDARARAILRLLVAEGRHFPELTAFYYDEVVARSGEVLAHIIDKGIARGEFVFAARDQAPRLLLGPPVMAVFWSILFEDKQKLDLDAMLDAHVDLVLHGLLREPEKAR